MPGEMDMKETETYGAVVLAAGKGKTDAQCRTEAVY